MPAAQAEVMDFKRGDRKASKPLMEKRRRARINHCLSQLKSLVVDRKHTENTRQAKLEKADILELTVRHLHDIRRQNRTVSLLNDTETEKFEMGYTECIKEVELFLSTSAQPGIEPVVRQRLRAHLLNRIRSIQHLKSPPPAETGPEPDRKQFQNAYGRNEVQDPPLQQAPPSPPSWEPSEEVSLVPKRLPNGDLAFVIPPQALEKGSRISGPLSAFRIICNHWASDSERCGRARAADGARDSCCSASPSPTLSSAVSEASVEEYQDEFFHNDLEAVARNDALQAVWRPW